MQNNKNIAVMDRMDASCIIRPSHRATIDRVFQMGERVKMGRCAISNPRSWKIWFLFYGRQKTYTSWPLKLTLFLLETDLSPLRQGGMHIKFFHQHKKTTYELLVLLLGYDWWDESVCVLISKQLYKLASN